QRRAARLAGLQIRLSIRVHLHIAELANNAAGQDALDENIVFQNHVVAGRAAQRFENFNRPLRPFRPLQWPDDRLHVRDSLDGLGMARGPVKAECGAPVVHDERDVALEIEALEERVEMPGMILEAIRASRRRTRRAHPDEIRRDASRMRREVRNDVAPEVRRGRIAVQENDRIAAAGVRVGNPGVDELQSFARVRVFLRNLRGNLRVGVAHDGISSRRGDSTDTTPPAYAQATTVRLPSQAWRAQNRGCQENSRVTRINRWPRIASVSSGDGATRTRGRLPNSKNTWPSGWPSDSGSGRLS